MIYLTLLTSQVSVMFGFGKPVFLSLFPSKEKEVLMHFALINKNLAAHRNVEFPTSLMIDVPGRCFSSETRNLRIYEDK